MKDETKERHYVIANTIPFSVLRLLRVYINDIDEQELPIVAWFITTLDDDPTNVDCAPITIETLAGNCAEAFLMENGSVIDAENRTWENRDKAIADMRAALEEREQERRK